MAKMNESIEFRKNWPIPFSSLRATYSKNSQIFNMDSFSSQNSFSVLSLVYKECHCFWIKRQVLFSSQLWPENSDTVSSSKLPSNDDSNPECGNLNYRLCWKFKFHLPSSLSFSNVAHYDSFLFFLKTIALIFGNKMPYLTWFNPLSHRR